MMDEFLWCTDEMVNMWLNSGACGRNDWLCGPIYGVNGRNGDLYGPILTRVDETVTYLAEF